MAKSKNKKYTKVINEQFINYQTLVEQFKQDIKEFIK